MAKLSASVIAILNAAGYVAPFNFAEMDGAKIAATHGFVSLKTADKLALMREIKDAKHIPTPSANEGGYRAEVDPTKCTVDEYFGVIYRGSAEKGGFKVSFKKGEKVTSKKGIAHDYQPQLKLTLIPQVVGATVKSDEFDVAQIQYAKPAEVWDNALAKNFVIVGNMPDDRKVLPFVDSLKVSIYGIELPLVEYLQEEVLPHLEKPVHCFVHKGKNGYILVGDVYTNREKVGVCR